MQNTLRKLYKKIFRNRLIRPLAEIKPLNIAKYWGFLAEYRAYKNLAGNNRENFGSLYPQLEERMSQTNIDPHYFYQSIWTARKIVTNKPEAHFDVGSQTDLIGFLTTIVPVTFIDLRPLDVNIPNLKNLQGDILNLPFHNNSIASLSCLHVAEHIGLGRYGDQLDPLGTKKACHELTRVLAPGGNLYFSLPIGKERTEFNAHRIHSPQTIAKYFENLQLVEFSAVNDQGQLVESASLDDFEKAKYGCGLFHFTKPAQSA